MQNRRVYIDDWCLMEKICLVSGVLRFGENSWPSICDLLKPKLQENRPWDWFTPDTCEAQYNILLNEYVKAHTNSENPALQIIQQLKTRCKIESQRKDEHWSKYMSLKKKLESLLKNEIEVELIERYYGEVQRKKSEVDERLRKHQEFLKERETKKSEFEKGNVTKTPQKQDSKTDGSSSPLVTSPLLSSLLNNPPAVQYRPTLSTTSFIPTKSTQSNSRSSSFEKSQSFIDSTFKDSFSQELSDQSRTAEKQSTPGISSSSVVKKLDFQDNVTSSTVPNIPDSVSESNIKVHTLSSETAKSDQNLENLALISPSEEVYLSEVDIPPEALLEVIDDLKVGTISLDKLIRDLEATEESVIIGKEDLQTVTVPIDDESFTEKVDTQSPIHEIKMEGVDVKDSKIAEEKVDIPANDIVEQIVETEQPNEEGSDEHVETDDIVNVEISSETILEEPKKDDCSASSTSYSTAVEVELEQSFSEPTSKNEVIDDTEFSSVKGETDKDETKMKSKSVVVIKRIEDGSNLANKSRRSKKIIAGENVEEFENVTVAQNITINEDEKSESKILVVENSQENDEAENLMKTVEITSENDTEEKQNDEMNNATNPDSEDSDNEKFEDALQTHVEEVSEQPNEIAEVAEKPESVSNIDESFVLEVDEKSEIQESSIEQVPEKDLEQSVEHPILDETNLPKKSENTDNDETTNVVENIERISEQEISLPEKEPVKEKNSEEIMLGPTKIIKKYGRKRKSVIESNEDLAEMSIRIPPVVLQEIETADSDIEQAFTEKNIKIEPSDPKPENRINQQKDEAAQEVSRIKENTSGKVKPERRDTKTPEKNVIKVLRRSSGKSHNSSRRNEDSKTKAMDNVELMKTRKKSIMLAYSRLTTHKYANAFQKPITNKQVPGYENVIYKPMDLFTIKKKIENRQISTVAEFQRDVLLMLNNAKMFNRTNSQVYNMAVEVEEDALPHIQLTVQTLGEGILRREEENNEKNRKRLSLDNAKKDSKSIKRIKVSTKEDNFPVVPLKKPKLEENDDDRGQTN